jgi:hypothetical protein
MFQKTEILGQILVAQTCNPRYLEGRDQEDCGSLSAWENSCRDPILKIINTKISGSCGKVSTYQAWGPEFKLKYLQKTKETNKSLKSYGCSGIFRIYLVWHGGIIWLCFTVNIFYSLCVGVLFWQLWRLNSRPHVC